METIKVNRFKEDKIMVQFVQYGTTILCDDKECVFSYDADIEKISLYLDEKLIPFPDGIDEIIGKKTGVTAGRYILYKLSVPLSNSTMTIADGKLIPASSGTLISPVDYYIENFQSNTAYTEMKLHFPELDFFISSGSMAKISEEEVTFSRIPKSLYQFDIQFVDTIVSISFDLKIDGHSNNNTSAETVSEVSLKFPKTYNREYITELYYRARAFFSFICNRKNIGLRSAELIGKCSCKRSREGKVVDDIKKTRQRIVFSQKYLEDQEVEKSVKKVPVSGLFSSNLKELFQMFFEEHVGGNPLVNASSIHRSFKFRNCIDLEQSLNITAAFEFYVRTMLPKISSEKSVEFYNDMQTILEEYIQNHTGKLKKKAKELKKFLTPQLSLKENIKKSYNGYSNWRSLRPILSDWFGGDVSNLANAANQWRNELAHEKREYFPDESTINAVRLVEHISYSIVLRYAGYDDEQIKAILEMTLAR